MPSDRIRQDEMSGDGPGHPRGRRGAAGSDLGGQGFGGQGFGAEPEEAPRRSRLLPLVIAFFALAAFAGIVWYAYEWGVGEVEPEHLPVVQAPRGPIKEKPAEPGGLEVPYTDSAVLNRSGDAGEAKVESLLPPPEEPVEVPPAPVQQVQEAQQAQQAQESAPESEPAPDAEPEPQTAEPSQDAGRAVPPTPSGEPTQPREPAGETLAEGEADVAEPAAPAETPADAVEAPEPAGEGAAEQQAPEQQATGEQAEAPAAPEPPVAAPEPVAEPPADASVVAEEVPEQAPEEAPEQDAARPDGQAAEPAPAELAPGSWVVQLAAVRQEAQARQEWQRIQRANDELLGAMPLQLERADLGERGIYYRVQTGPLPNRATALDLCAQLKATGQDCIIKQR